jgi:hypothetical protein
MTVVSNVVALLLATFDLRFLMAYRENSSLYFREFLHGSCLVKDLISVGIY